jgi:hypothetical protein
MFNSVQFVRDVCHQRRIPVSALEKACGFANGYLNPKKMTRISYDRAVLISKYLDIPVTRILTGKDENPDTVPVKRAVTDEDIKFALFGGDGEITDAMYEEVKRFAAFIKHREADK